MDASTASLDVGRGEAHPELLRVDAQAEKNERHGKSRVKTGAATSEESRRRMSPSSAFSRRGPSGGWWFGGGWEATLSNTKQMPNTLRRSEGSEQVMAFSLSGCFGIGFACRKSN